VTALVLAVLVASLLGSLHCAGMCGGFVAFYAGDVRGRDARTGHACYNSGRLLSYATLGALAGALGAALDLGGAVIGVQRVAAVVAGALIALWGTGMLLAALGRSVPRLDPPTLLATVVRRGIARFTGRRPAARAFVIGLLTGCLPCGWLYGFVATAAGTGSVASGAAVMVVFWLGTLPAMVSLGLGLRALAGPLGRRLPAACAAAMIIVGLLAVAGRFVEPPMPVSLRHAGTHGGR
jgi:uncharacterized protein